MTTMSSSFRCMISVPNRFQHAGLLSFSAQFPGTVEFWNLEPRTTTLTRTLARRVRLLKVRSSSFRFFSHAVAWKFIVTYTLRCYIALGFNAATYTTEVSFKRKIGNVHIDFQLLPPPLIVGRTHSPICPQTIWVSLSCPLTIWL